MPDTRTPRTGRLRRVAAAVTAGALVLVPTAAVAVRVASRQPAWSTPQPISEPDRYAATPAMVVDRRGVTTAAWTRDFGEARSEVVVRRRAPGGAWGPITTVDDNAEGPMSIVADSEGRVTIVYTRWLRGPHVRAVSSDTTGHFGASVPLIATGTAYRGPRLVVDRSGTVTAGWVQRDHGTERIVVARRQAGGSWTSPHFLTARRLESNRVDLAVSGSGAITAAWTQRPLGSPGSTKRVVTKTLRHQRWSRQRTVSRAARIDSVAVAGGVGDSVLVAWGQYDRTGAQALSRWRRADGVWVAPVRLGGRHGRGQFLAVEDAVVGAGLRAVAWGQGPMGVEFEDPGPWLTVRVHSAARGWGRAVQMIRGRTFYEGAILRIAPNGLLWAAWMYQPLTNGSGDTFVAETAHLTRRGRWLPVQRVADRRASGMDLPALGFSPDGARASLLFAGWFWRIKYTIR